MASPTQHIVITGGSRGVGAALAIAWAQQAGKALRLSLIARDRESLDRISERCQNHGSVVSCYSQDLQDIGASEALLATIEKQHPVDIAVFNSGISGDTVDGLECSSQVVQILHTNLLSTAALATNVAQNMQRHGQGQLVFINSIAAFRALPLTPTYCASKAGLKAFSDGLRGKLAQENINVLSVYPGFIDTEMTKNYRGKVSMLKQPEDLARRIISAVDHRRAVLVYPLALGIGQKALDLLPARLGDKILRWLGYS